MTSQPNKVNSHAYEYELFLLLSVMYNLQGYKITQRQRNCRDNLDNCPMMTSLYLFAHFKGIHHFSDALPLTSSVRVPFPCPVVCATGIPK